MRKFLLSLAVMATLGTAMGVAQENLWLNANPTKASVYYAPGWTESTNYKWDLTADGITVELKDATSDRWQAQFPIETTLAVTADKAYNFSFDIVSNNEFTALVKFTQNGDDNNYSVLAELPLKANETLHFSKTFSDANIDPVKVFFDFGFNPANTNITVSNISLVETEKIVITEPEGPNLWENVELTLGEPYYAPDWNPSTNYTAEITSAGNVSIELNDATFATWQAQFPVFTNLKLQAGTEYYFGCEIRSNTEFIGHAKFMQKADDNLFVVDENINLEAKVNEFKVIFDGKDINELELLFDFGGNPELTSLLIRKFVLKVNGDPGSVGSIANEMNDPAEYYNLQGIRVDNPNEGIYIVRRGNVVTKEIIKK